jgi:hypothetical protein
LIYLNDAIGYTISDVHYIDYVMAANNNHARLGDRGSPFHFIYNRPRSPASTTLGCVNCRS